MDALSSWSTVDLAVAAAVVVVLGLILLRSGSGRSSDPTKLPEWTAMLPWAGNIVEFGKNPVNFVIQGRERFGDIFKTKIFGKNMVFITHPKAHEVFFSAQDEELSPREVYQFIVPVFGKGIIYDADPWPALMNEQLRFVTTGMSQSRYKIFVDNFLRESNEFFATWGDSGEVDIFHALSELTILTASRCLLGREIRDNLKDNNFAKLYHDLEQSLNPVLFFLPWLPTFSARVRNGARSKITGLFSKVMAERRRNASANDAQVNVDLLQALIDAKYDERFGGRPLTDDEISGILLATLFAGQHTSSITSSWTALELIHRKEWHGRVMDEQKEVMAKHRGQLSVDSVNDMALMKRCMKEVLRLYPPLVLLMRMVKKERKCGPFTIPVGSILTVSPAASMKIGDVFENPATFDPDRFIAPREEDKKYQYAFIGFGGGRHRCLGESFAYLQVSSILSVMFRTFDFEPLDPFPNVNYDSMVAGPKPPCRVRYARKKQSP